ncbi:RHS repeat-associated core domain-containing protein [Planoprotostelium fungivorum]|uniref:RHS repeat-associated core domain-containing protein n=1 Tax=Planoprotostelium fungivorum TaxID=1890364 RepID=A0A2P6N788_9EUKA|nr:RHS repeat-associated core domain-containing protein [Planoprotostelium fungivorum]
MRPTVLFVLFLCIAQGRALYPFSTSIPQLTQFFHDLHGEEWYNSTGWLQSSDPCDGKWYGINCTIIDDRSLFPIPIQVANISLEDNSLRGTITTKIPLVVYLNLASNNDISGNITSDSFWENTVYLDLSKNHLQGTIPDLSKFALLRYADLSSNYFDGPIEFSSTTSKLELLDLSNNRLKGVIPSNLGTAVNLQSLMLTNNQLFSTIPSSFCNLVSLQQMILSFNFLFGQIPSCIGDLTNMRDLELRSNNLQGYIPSSIYQLNQVLGKSLFQSVESDSAPNNSTNPLYFLDTLGTTTSALNGLVYCPPPWSLSGPIDDKEKECLRTANTACQAFRAQRRQQAQSEREQREIAECQATLVWRLGAEYMTVLDLMDVYINYG